MLRSLAQVTHGIAFRRLVLYTAVSTKVVQQNCTRQRRKVLWVMGFMVLDWGFRCFSDIEGNITNKSIYAFSVLVGKHREPQSINAKLFLPIIPIGIVAYAFTLLWDNLCQNSCMCTLVFRRNFSFARHVATFGSFLRIRFWHWLRIWFVPKEFQKPQKFNYYSPKWR